ncbi:hypothetical protein AVEN_252521-1 [Araneus ventricosus]|uniref:ATP-dependent DNA helicase n=1 Tax=Araneus ventricosus TaxID=182803 RepID=A0A4Y2ATQ7_ARAVE|nr:hypothetical protein AVEN_252521-1 [Araneus ventricosus]
MNAIRGVYEASPKTFSVNGFAGSGKSFSFNALIRSVRGLGEIAVSIAWTGIAAIILEGGRRAHSRFMLPVPTLDNSSCSIRHNTEDGRFLKAAKLIIWDECTMTPHHALIAVDRLLRDLTSSNLPFGGKIFVLGGELETDFACCGACKQNDYRDLLEELTSLEQIQTVFTRYKYENRTR